MSRIRRRQFLTAAGALLATGVARAQPAPKVRRIGVLFQRDAAAPMGPLEKAFLAELARLGYEEGRNLVIERRYAAFKIERIPELARELIQANVELIVAPSNTTTLAARSVTSTVPIVATMGKSVEYGLVKSFARPGGNITGTDWLPGISVELKCYEMLKEAVPSAKRAGHLFYSTAFKNDFYGDTYAQKILERTGLAVTTIGVAQGDELDSALEKIAASKPDVFYVYGHEFFTPYWTKIASFAAGRKLASISDLPFYLNSGGMLYYGALPMPMMLRSASFVARILNGAKPADLPVEHPTQFELVLNRKVAEAIGVKLPQAFLLRVDRVVE